MSHNSLLLRLLLPLLTLPITTIITITGISRFIAPCLMYCFPQMLCSFQIEGKTLHQHKDHKSLYGGLEPNLQCPRDMPVLSLWFTHGRLSFWFLRGMDHTASRKYTSCLRVIWGKLGTGRFLCTGRSCLSPAGAKIC